jgi:hypothetical protein
LPPNPLAPAAAPRPLHSATIGLHSHSVRAVLFNNTGSEVFPRALARLLAHPNAEVVMRALFVIRMLMQSKDDDCPLAFVEDGEFYRTVEGLLRRLEQHIPTAAEKSTFTGLAQWKAFKEAVLLVADASAVSGTLAKRGGQVFYDSRLHLHTPAVCQFGWLCGW